MATVDLRIQNKCNHRISIETVSIDSDGLTLRPLVPIQSMGSLSVRRFGVKLNKTEYYLESEDNLVVGSTYRVIKLFNRDKYTDPVYDVSYATTLKYCPKCVGTEYTDDIYTKRDGEFKTVTDEFMLAQQAEKHVVTDVESNKYHLWIGSGLRSLINTKVTDLDFITSEVKKDIRSALNKMKEAQLKHEQANPLVDSSEVMGNIKSIEVLQDAADPSIVEAFVTYTAASGKTLEYSQVLELSTFRPR